MQQKKIPLRKCTGCGEMKPKKELVRIVRSPQGDVSLDKTGRSPGRGAYICPSPVCVRKAKKGKRLDKAFDCAVPESIYDSLETELTG